MTGCLEILNITDGDTKITFDGANAQEVIRAGRIIADMLRRGYALVVEVERNGEKRYERVQAFDEKAHEYVIADFDPVHAHESDVEEGAARLERGLAHDRAEADRAQAEAVAKAKLDDQPEPTLCGCGKPLHHRGSCPGTSSRKGQRRRLPVEGTRATAIGRSAGG